ncbi:hypothetical protein GCM10027589_41890 [Actinocorallia lasiicapitis]
MSTVASFIRPWTGTETDSEITCTVGILAPEGPWGAVRRADAEEPCQALALEENRTALRQNSTTGRVRPITLRWIIG